MHAATEAHGDFTCSIEEAGQKEYVGTLSYRTWDVGTISGPDLANVRAQFGAICQMIDAGAMLRHGIIMLGYRNGDYVGDVLLVDGEILGEWNSDELEWYHFTASGSGEITCSAPSPWMLHDAIARWVSGSDDTNTL
jgi:hypothetical protein